jgi:acetyltransferase-like isoleucine patch superfamily enzyme
MQPINRDSLPHLVACFAGNCKSMVHTGMARAAARWWGIELGEACRFYGLPLFRRIPGSGIRIGRNCQFRSAVWSNQVGLNRRCTISTLYRGALIEIGEGCGFSSTAISAAQSVTIGNRVMCGANVAIMDTDWHPMDAEERQAGAAGPSAPVFIGDDVWLGLNVTVLKGVTIGARTVVAAGSVVTRSLPEDIIAAGQPARVVRAVREKSPKLTLVNR